MTIYKNTNESYGDDTIFNAEDIDAAVASIRPILALWADDQYLSLIEDPDESREEWIASCIKIMETEFRDGLRVPISVRWDDTSDVNNHGWVWSADRDNWYPVLGQLPTDKSGGL